LTCEEEDTLTCEEEDTYLPVRGLDRHIEVDLLRAADHAAFALK